MKRLLLVGFLLVAACGNEYELEWTPPFELPEPYWTCTVERSQTSVVKFTSCNADDIEIVTEQNTEWVRCRWYHAACSGRVSGHSSCLSGDRGLWIVYMRRFDCHETYTWAPD